jgi:hypothetical protein
LFIWGGARAFIFTPFSVDFLALLWYNKAYGFEIKKPFAVWAILPETSKGL